MRQETKTNIEIKIDEDKTPMIKLDETNFETACKTFLREQESFSRKRKAVKILLYLNSILFISLVFLLSLLVYVLWGEFKR